MERRSKKRKLTDAISALSGLCNLLYWDDYVRGCTECGEHEGEETYCDDIYIVSAYLSFFQLLLLHAEKMRILAGFSGSMYDSDEIISFRDGCVDDCGSIWTGAWLAMADRYGYSFPEHLNYSPYDDFEYTPVTTGYDLLSLDERVLEFIFEYQKDNYCGPDDADVTFRSLWDNLTPENEALIRDVIGEFDGFIFSQTNSRFQKLERLVHSTDGSILTDDFRQRYNNLSSRISHICGCQGYAFDWDVIQFSDGTSANISLGFFIFDDMCWKPVAQPLVAYVDFPELFNMPAVDREIKKMMREFKALRKEARLEQKKKSPCA